jgi:hypothetical protein
VREGEELKAPRHASAAASCDDHVTTYNIIPNSYNITRIKKKKSTLERAVGFYSISKDDIYGSNKVLRKYI